MRRTSSFQRGVETVEWVVIAAFLAVASIQGYRTLAARVVDHTARIAACIGGSGCGGGGGGGGGDGAGGEAPGLQGVYGLTGTEGNAGTPTAQNDDERLNEWNKRMEELANEHYRERMERLDEGSRRVAEEMQGPPRPLPPRSGVPFRERVIRDGWRQSTNVEDRRPIGPDGKRQDGDGSGWENFPIIEPTTSPQGKP